MATSTSTLCGYKPTHNGRINIVTGPIDQRLMLSDRIPVDDKASAFRDAMTGNWYDTRLSTAFFSAQNVQIIQNGLRAGVYERSKGRYVIGPQNQDELKIIMRSIFLQYSKNLPDNIPQQIAELNNIVLNYAVERVYGEAVGYIKYKEDASNMYTLIPPPVLAYSNDKLLELQPFF